MEHTPEQTAPGAFELSGGDLSLDFANTWGNHADPGSDRLTAYDRLVAFAGQTGSVDKKGATALRRAAGASPQQAADTLAFARDLRGALYRIFAARAACRDMPIADVERLNEVLGEALSHRRLRRDGDTLDWTWIPMDTTDLRAPLWPVVAAAATLLTSDDLGRIRECDADDCNWLFIDQSRSRSRRWCSMQSCGNRAKARRHYRRQREG